MTPEFEGRTAHAHQPAPAPWLQVVRRADRARGRAGPDGRGRAQRLRQVEPARGAALGDGRDLAQEHARGRHGRRDLLRHGDPARPQHGGSDDLHRQFGATGALRVQRQRHAGGDAPHRARGGLGLPHQRPRGARPRRAHPVRGRSHRRALAGAGAPGPDRRARQCQARAAPPHPRGRCRHRRPAQPPPRGRAAPQGRRGQPRPHQRHPGPALLADREPEAAGPRGAALQGDIGRDPQARRHRLPPALAGGAGAGRCRGGRACRRAGEGGPRHRGRGQGDQGRGGGRRQAAALARGRGRQGRRPRPLPHRAGEPRARGQAHGRAPARACRPRRAACPRQGPRAGADRRGQGDDRPPRRRDGLARQHRPPRRRLRAEGARRPRRGREHAQECRSAPHLGHDRRGRGAGPPPEPRDAEERAARADRQARAPAHRPRRADAARSWAARPTPPSSRPPPSSASA